MKKIFFLLFISCAGFSQAQKQANIWCFGNGCGLDFNSGSPVFFPGVAMAQFEGCTSVADTSGNLLFYSDGISVWNKNHQLMPNGTGLFGGYSSTQSGVIVKQPGNTNIYFLFTTDDFGGPNGLNYSIVDMSLQGGLGDLTIKNVLLLSACDERISIVNHANGNDVWIITTQNFANLIHAFLLTPAGLNLVPITSVNAVVHTNTTDFAGYMKASPTGDRLGIAMYGTGSFEILDFDNSTAIASNGFDMVSTNYAFAYGIEFSSDGTKLYGCEEQFGIIYQFNLLAGSSAAIAASATVVGATGAMQSGALQIGPDKKIYVAKVLADLGVINDPNQLGVACNYVNSGVNLSTGICEGGLPNFPVSIFNSSLPTALLNVPNQICPGSCIDFTNLSTNATAYQWNFPGAAPDTSTAFNPTDICYINPGSYDVQLIATNINGSDTLLLTSYITVFPVPPPQGIQQTGDTLFAIAGASIYQWYFNGSIINGATDYFYVATSSGDYNVVATDNNGCEVEAVINDVLAGLTPALSKGEGVAIFPNPVEDKFTMHNTGFTMGTAVKISIYNVLGEKVLVQESRGKMEEEIIDVSKLGSGLYYLEVISGGKISRAKFVKQ